MAGWPNGKALDYESRDCRFDPCVGQNKLFFPGRPIAPSLQELLVRRRKEREGKEGAQQEFHVLTGARPLFDTRKVRALRRGGDVWLGRRTVSFKLPRRAGTMSSTGQVDMSSAYKQPSKRILLLALSHGVNRNNVNHWNFLARVPSSQRSAVVSTGLSRREPLVSGLFRPYEEPARSQFKRLGRASSARAQSRRG